ncbi:hypothetical protein HY492_02345 [Candidatus Woesearchaeota archaeon]|nr:hypothetical protein [Candidatus Woesearchaeota archaeon]
MPKKSTKKPTVNVRNNITIAEPMQMHEEKAATATQLPFWRRASKKIWWFIWEDTSVWSWLANIALAFILIKFLVYPGLGLVLGTSHPIVAVVSGSMEHDYNFDAWWVTPRCVAGSSSKSSMGMYALYGITKGQFEEYPFHNGFNKGDLMVLKRPTSISVGDVVVFDGGMNDPIIHRVIILANGTLSTQGDNNCASAGFEQDLTQDRLIGKASLRIPLLGWIKIGFVELIKLVTGA